MISNQDNGNGTRTFHWHTSYAIPTYLICMAITNYQSFTQWYVGLNGDSMQITNYAYPEYYNNMVHDCSIVPNALHIYASRFGEYPFFHEKFGYSMFPWSGGMEHQENVFMGYWLFDGNHGYDWITVHEMSHHWFGDAITCDTWPNVWMNEGFASYCEALYYEQMQGFDAYVSYEVNDNSVSDPSGPIYNPSELFDGNTVYNKGSWVLHMLRGVMGDSAFFHGMYNYENNSGHQYGTITTRDFQHLMEPFYGDSLGWFFDEWVWGQNRPNYRYSWIKQDLGNGQYEVFLHVRQTQTSPAPDVFTMPIKIYPHINGVDTMITVWDDRRIDDFRFVVNGNPTSLAFDKVPWILSNAASETYTMNIVTTTLPNGTVGVAYSDTIEARGGVTPYHFTLQGGQLPAGLTLTNSGILSGTPTAVQVDTFTIRCTDTSSPAKTDDQTFFVTISPSQVLEILTLSLPDGRQDSAYEEMIQVQGGIQPYHFSITSGHIPTGLILDEVGGSISGIPTIAEVDTFTVHCQDSSPLPLSNDHTYIVTIAPAAGCHYISGDINGNGLANGVDIVYAVNYLKGALSNPPQIDCGTPVGQCPEASPFYAAADVNGSCAFNGVDITFFVRFLKSEVPNLLYCPDCPPSP